MKDVLNISDYISLHLPLNESTKGVINTETLKELELNKLPKYVYSNINKFKDWLYIKK